MDDRTKKSIPTWITLSRIAFVPIICALAYFEMPYSGFWAAVLFALASITDYFDGYYARKWNAITNYGKFMDPVADKILVSAILVLLVFKSFVDPLAVILIIARDTYISGIRAVAAADQIIIAAKTTGKWKAALQMATIPFLLMGNEIGTDSSLFKFAYATLWVSVILSLTSAWDYHSSYYAEKKRIKGDL